MTDATGSALRSIVAKSDASIVRAFLFWLPAWLSIGLPVLMLILIVVCLAGKVDADTQRFIEASAMCLAFWLFGVVIAILTRAWAIYRNLPKIVSIDNDTIHLKTPAKDVHIDPSTCIWWHGEIAHDELGIILPWRRSLVLHNSEQRTCIVPSNELEETQWLAELRRLGVVQSRLQPWRRMHLCMLIGLSPFLFVLAVSILAGFGTLIDRVLGVSGWAFVIAGTGAWAILAAGFLHFGALWRRPLPDLPQWIPRLKVSGMLAALGGMAAYEKFESPVPIACSSILWGGIGFLIAESFVRIAWPRE